jgi:glycosyltransferase involved in cell wall biosynthesis
VHEKYLSKRSLSIRNKIIETLKRIKNMRVAWDCSTAAFEQKTGTGVYVEELIKHYVKLFPKDKVTHSYRLSRRIKGRPYLLELSKNSTRDTIIDPLTFLSGLKYEIFHGLNSRLPVLSGCKKIATIHDLFSIKSKFSDPIFLKDQTVKLEKMIARADHLIVPATFTADILVNEFGIKKQNVTVIGQGVRDVFLKMRDRAECKDKIRNKFSIQNPFILFVGTLEKRKNVTGLIQSYISLSKKQIYSNEKVYSKEHIYAKEQKSLPDLVLVGHPGYLFSEISKEIESSGLKDKIKILGFVDEEWLAELYTACELFAFISLEEGFGIPLIEAMACGAPVVCSNTTSLPEASGGHAWEVSPNKPDEVAAVLEEVLMRTPKIIDKASLGQKFALHETWGKVARLTREVYQEVLPRR